MGSVQQIRACDEDDIPSGCDCGHIQPDDLTHTAACPVAHDGLANAPAGRETKAAMSQIVAQCTEHNQTMPPTFPLLPGALEISPIPQAILALHPPNSVPAALPASRRRLIRVPINTFGMARLRGQLVTPLQTSGLEHSTPPLRAHPCPKPVDTRPMTFLRLIRALRHRGLSPLFP